jgi:hypothetical protein
LEIPLANQLQDGYAVPLERKPEHFLVDVSFGVFMSEATNKRPLVAQITTVLSYVCKIAKLSFDIYTLVHFGH